MSTSSLKLVESVPKVKTGYLLAKRTDTKHLPFWGRLFVEQIVLRAIRLAFKRWGWTNDLEAQSFCGDIDTADELKSGKERWVIHPVPINGCLPDETCAYGESLAAGNDIKPNIPDYKDIALRQVGEEAKRLRERLERHV